MLSPLRSAGFVASAFGQRNDAQRGVLIDRRQRHDRHILRARDGHRRKSPKPKSAFSLPTSRIASGEPEPLRISATSMSFLAKKPFSLRDEEHRVVAAHHPVELDVDLVGGQRRR